MELKNDVICEGSERCSAKEVEIFSYLLGSALRHENPSKFLEIYERIPRHYTQELVEEIKEESRLIGELSDYDFQMLSERLNCSRPDNKDIYISPAMSDNEVIGNSTTGANTVTTATTLGTLTRNKTRNSSQGSKDSSTASANEVSDIINNNDSAVLHTAKLFQKTGELNMTVVAIAGKNEAVLPTSFIDGENNPRKDSQSSGIYESCDDTTASAAQKTSKSRKKKKRNKAKRQALMAASGMSEQEVFDTVKENRLADGTGAGGGGDDSTSTSSCLNNLSGNHSLKSTLSSSTDTVSPSSIHNISPVVTTNDDIRNNQQNNNRHQNQQQQIHNLKANVQSQPDYYRTHHQDTSQNTPPKSSSNLPRNTANHDPNIHNSLPIHNLQDCDPNDGRLTENSVPGFVCDDYEESFYNAEEFQEVKRKSRNGSRNVAGSQQYPDALYSRKSAASGASKQMPEMGLRNGIVSPIESINSSNSSLNAPSSASGSQTIPSNGAKPQREPDLHSYANRLKSSLQQSICSNNNQRNSNPTSTEQQQKQSSKPQNNSSSNQHAKNVDAKGAAVALPKNSLKRPNSNNEQSTFPNSKAQVKTPTKNHPNEMPNCNSSISPTSSESNLSSRKPKNSARKSNRRSCENLVEGEGKLPTKNFSHEEAFGQVGCNADNNLSLSFQFDEKSSRITNNNDLTSNCLESISKQTNNVELKEGNLVTETSLYNSNQESTSNPLLTTLNTNTVTAEKLESNKSTEHTDCNVPLELTRHLQEPISQSQQFLNHGHGEPNEAVNPTAAERLRNETTEIPVSVEMPYMKSEASGHSLPLATFGGDVCKTGQLSTGCSLTGARADEPGSQHHQLQLGGEGCSGKRKYQEYGRGGSKVGQLMFGNLDINDEELNRFGVGDFDLFQATSLLAKTWNAWSSRESKDKEWLKLAEDCSRASSSCAEAASSVPAPSTTQ